MDAYNLLDESFTTVSVRFYNDDEDQFYEKGKSYNYKVPKTWNVAAGDLLIVPATSTLRIVKVAEVHAEPQFNGLPNLRYAVLRVDMTEYDELAAREAKFRNALQQVERQRKKAEIIETLKTSVAGSPAAAVLLGDALTMIGVGSVATEPHFEPAPAAPRSFGDGPAHADAGHAGFTPPVEF